MIINEGDGDALMMLRGMICPGEENAVALNK